ncbi:von Willebrand factor C domain-containing protein 2-like [Bulinus truncatus]|nr:von Willebrand factor C domain-containing protein 2-like [Bulinus truncatus]
MGTVTRIGILASCLVSISVAMTIVQTTTSEAPSDTSSQTPPDTTFIITTARGCQNKPKPVDEGPCSPCECQSDGEWVCMIIDCVVAPCVDPHTEPNQCCSTCPSGPNCMIEGKIVSFNYPEVMPDGRVCYCVQDEIWSPPSYKCDLNTSAPEEITTPPGCLNEPKPDEGPCAFCDCVNDGGRWKWICYYRDCMRPECDNYYTPPGQCCPVCPDRM